MSDETPTPTPELHNGRRWTLTGWRVHVDFDDAAGEHTWALFSTDPAPYLNDCREEARATEDELGGVRLLSWIAGVMGVDRVEVILNPEQPTGPGLVRVLAASAPAPELRGPAKGCPECHHASGDHREEGGCEVTPCGRPCGCQRSESSIEDEMSPTEKALHDAYYDGAAMSERSHDEWAQRRGFNSVGELHAWVDARLARPAPELREGTGKAVEDGGMDASTARRLAARAAIVDVVGRRGIRNETPDDIVEALAAADLLATPESPALRAEDDALARVRAKLVEEQAAMTSSWANAALGRVLDVVDAVRAEDGGGEEVAGRFSELHGVRRTIEAIGVDAPASAVSDYVQSRLHALALDDEPGPDAARHIGTEHGGSAPAPGDGLAAWLDEEIGTVDQARDAAANAGPEWLYDEQRGRALALRGVRERMAAPAREEGGR